MEETERITPLDIEGKEFSKSFRGYNSDEVDDFLDNLAQSFELFIRENLKLKREISALKEERDELKNKVEEYKKDEDTFRKTLVSAQQRSEEIEKEAEKKRDLTLREAEIERGSIISKAKIEAENILKDANFELQDIKKEVVFLKRERDVFIVKMKSIIESFSHLLDSLEKETLNSEINEE